jgi:glycosyltransferase involved in cell wall biosynthesis
VEAGAVGIPVIATAVGGIPELIGDDGGLLVGPRDHEMLANAIRKCLHDSESAKLRSERLRARVTSDYCVDRNAEKLRDLYAAIINAEVDKVK